MRFPLRYLGVLGVLGLLGLVRPELSVLGLLSLFVLFPDPKPPAHTPPAAHSRANRGA